MKKLIGLMIALTLGISICVCGGETETQEVTQEQIEENIIGTWMKSEEDGHPTLTNEKLVFDIISTSQVFSSISRDDGDAPWHNNEEGEIEIANNVMRITTIATDGSTTVDEYTITDIGDNEFTANRKVTSTSAGSEPRVMENVVSFKKINEDYSEDILGTWEGHCTSENSVFDDGQEHRWEIKEDGTYVYYVKDGDNWVPSDNEINEYFVAGTLLCFRWVDGGTENREWWEITIDDDTMNWTALREGEDGKTFTATFEMDRVTG